MYGESSSDSADTSSANGLSPRVRGIHGKGTADQSYGGSIPACTGNPVELRRRRRFREVYPRVYGESDEAEQHFQSVGGLSPRVRGILVRPLSTRRGPGSIPACTGNPADAVNPTHEYKVYPRVYGESPAGRHQRLQSSGLSPRVRGIQQNRRTRHRSRRSIPACTGNPCGTLGRLWHRKVYPRVYGESRPDRHELRPRLGLSPRVRGIPIIACGTST